MWHSGILIRETLKELTECKNDSLKSYGYGEIHRYGCLPPSISSQQIFLKE